jgi:hypothetical protein
MRETIMTYKAVRDLAEFPAVVIAAFAVRNAGVLIVLSALALSALVAS